MAPKLLKILKKGLVKFMEAIKTRKTKLSEKLAQAETISSSDEHWTIRLVFKGPVWSGFFAFFGRTGNRNRFLVALIVQ